MARPLKRPGTTPAPASTPAPAPAPAPVAAKPASKPVEPRREEPKREESKREKERSAPMKQAAPPALSEPTGDFTPPTDAERAATAARALGAQTAAKAAKVAATTSSPSPVAKAALGGPETTAVYYGPQAPDPYEKYYEALGRVEELRRQGKIGVQQRVFGGGRGAVGSYGVQVTGTEVAPKAGREPFVRRPYASQVDTPTAQELDVRELGAKKMQQVMLNRDGFVQLKKQNDREIIKLEEQLKTERDAPFDDMKSRADQMRARAARMEAISRQLKQMAAQQRALTQRILTEEATLREYGMTDAEIKSR